MCAEIEVTRNFLDLLNVVEKEFGDIIHQIKQTELELSDLNHSMELENFNAYEGYILAKKVQETRKRRRVLKNLREILQPMKDFVDQNKKLKIDLFKVLNTMEKTEEDQKNRVYYPRVRMDIKLAKIYETETRRNKSNIEFGEVQ